MARVRYAACTVFRKFTYHTYRAHKITQFFRMQPAQACQISHMFWEPYTLTHLHSRKVPYLEGQDRYTVIGTYVPGKPRGPGQVHRNRYIHTTCEFFVCSLYRVFRKFTYHTYQAYKITCNLYRLAKFCTFSGYLTHLLHTYTAGQPQESYCYYDLMPRPYALKTPACGFPPSFVSLFYSLNRKLTVSRTR